MFELKETPTTSEKTSKGSVSGDTMQIDQTNVTINFEDDHIVNFNQPKSHSKKIQDQLKLVEEEKRKLKEENKKIEEAKLKLLEEEKMGKEGKRGEGRRRD